METKDQGDEASSTVPAQTLDAPMENIAIPLQHQPQSPPEVQHPPQLHALPATMVTAIPFNGSNMLPLNANLDLAAAQGMPMVGPVIMDVPSTAINGAASHTANPRDISADEIALYDRQIRLWGMSAQKRVQNARVLLITIKGLGNEIAKNLVLAGIGSLTIIDDHVVTVADLGAQFFLSEANLGQNRAQAASENVKKLNPRVSVVVDTQSIMTVGPTYFGNFDIVIATDLSPMTLTFINTATRLHNVQFYATAVHGFYGYIFCDLIEHDYVLEREKPNVATKVGPETRTRSVIDVKTRREGNKTIEMVTKRELYSTWDLAAELSLLPPEYSGSKRRLKSVTPALPCFRALWNFQHDHGRLPTRTPDGHGLGEASAKQFSEDLGLFTKSAQSKHQLLKLPQETLRADFLRAFTQNIGTEIAPVTAILGGQLAQDVINVLGQKQPPIQNMVIFDGNTLQAETYPLHPDEGHLGKAQLELVAAVVPPPPTELQQQRAPVIVPDPNLYQSMGNLSNA